MCVCVAASCLIHASLVFTLTLCRHVNGASNYLHKEQLRITAGYTETNKIQPR